ncbi:polarity establishment/cellular polarization [Savitreella phatthalungensis]
MLVSLLTFAQLALGAPTLGYPFNSQVPPVARINTAYSYQLPTNTFSNVAADVKYTLSGAPGWLSLDSATLTLRGTPATTDAGAPSFNIIATDSTGSASDPCVLVVSANPAPVLSIPLAEQLRSIGTVDGRGGLIVTPGMSFHIPFSSKTFTEVGTQLSAFYGTSDSFNPLPTWVSFDSSTLTFSGTAPPVRSAIAPPQYFQFVLVGSDYAGFSAISASFDIVVGAHSLAFSTVSYERNATAGSPFSFQIPSSTLLLDGATIGSANISSIVAKANASWVNFDPTTLTLSGTPPSGSTSQVSVVVTATDVFSDVASTTVDIVFGGSQSATDQLFTATLPSALNATAGTFFSYTFNSSIVPASVDLQVSISGLSWLTYNSNNRTLYGTVPTSSNSKAKRQSSGTITVTASANGQSSTQSIGINILPSSADSSSTSATTTSTSATATSATRSSSAVRSASTTLSNTTRPSASASASNSAASVASAGASNSNTDDAGKRLSKGAIVGIALGVAAGVLAIIAAIVFFCCCARRRRGGGDSVHSASSVNISRPVGDKDQWPSAANPGDGAYDKPRQLGAFDIFKSASDGRMSAYVAHVQSDVSLAPPLAPELPPLPHSPALAKSISDEDNSLMTSTEPAAGPVNKSAGAAPSPTPSRIAQPQAKNVRNRLSVLYSSADHRESAASMDTVDTNEMFGGVRVVNNRDLAPPIARAVSDEPASASSGQLPSSNTQSSNETGRSIGTYSSSEGGYIERYGSRDESLSSGHITQASAATRPTRNYSHQTHASLQRQDSTTQPWRVTRSQQSYGSFGSYATTSSGVSDEFSFDEDSAASERDGSSYDAGDANNTSLHPHYAGATRVFEPLAEETEDEDEGAYGVAPPLASPITTVATRRGPGAVSQVILDAPYSPDWRNTDSLSPAAAAGSRTAIRNLDERLARHNAANSRDTTPSASSGNVRRDDTMSSGEMAFV